jgi:uncharacterized protein YndB with AHSA1/START domain
MNLQTLTFDQYVAVPPAAVWHSIATPEGIASWWAPGDIAPVVGHRFVLEMPGWGNVACEVLEVEVDRLLVHTFFDWTLQWRLEPEGRGTRLFLEHRGFDLDNPQHRFAFDHMGPGWRDEVLPRLVAHAESRTSS